MTSQNIKGFLSAPVFAFGVRMFICLVMKMNGFTRSEQVDTFDRLFATAVGVSMGVGFYAILDLAHNSVVIRRHLEKKQ